MACGYSGLRGKDMAFWDSWFGGNDDSYDQASEYLNKIEPMLQQNYSPYINNGNQAGTDLQSQLSMLLQNPASVQALLGQGYTQSPGYQYSLDQALGAQNNAAAAGGYAGSPQHQINAAKTATGEASQDYWKYLTANQNLYNQGLSGSQDMYNTGFNATNNLSSGLGNLYGSQANLQLAQTQSSDDMLASLLGAAGGIGGAFLGGPGGAAIGSSLGGILGNLFGGGGQSNPSQVSWSMGQPSYNYKEPSFMSGTPQYLGQ